MSRSQQRTIPAAHGGTRHLRRWAPAGGTRAVVALSHGYAEHSGRYEAVGGALADAGIDSFAVDLRGHGESSGERASAPSLDALVEDANLAVAAAREASPEAPLFVVGHSMGGLVATALVLDSAAPIRGLVLSGAAVDDPSGLEFLLAAESIPEIALDSALLSRDPEVGRRYDEDPRNYRGPFRRETLHTLADGARRVRARFAELRLPLLVMHGSADAIVPEQASIDLHRAAASIDKTLVLHPGLRHEIFNEPEGPAIVATMIEWILARA